MLAITPFNHNRRLSSQAHHRAMRELDDFFDRLLWAPDLSGSRNFREFDMYEKDGRLFLSIEAAGANPEDLEVRIFKDRVSIKSSKEAVEKAGDEEDGRTWYNKKTVCNMDYEITLPFEIDTEDAEANFAEGVIHISAPRLERSESKVIPLKKG